MATRDDRAALIDTVVVAFDQDPAFRYFFGDELFAVDAPAFVGALFDSRVDAGATWITDDAGAVAMWANPEADSVRSDFGALDPSTRARLAAYDEATHAALPDSPFWYLGILATHPNYRGLRLGRSAMQPGLDRSRETGLPAYLETTSDANVAMYERSGWETSTVTEFEDLAITVLRYTGAAD
ncbi:MAG: GNAT family N-acetyltransferase [Acidimicrobiales bacterium]|nr:GNAT family N-acetyltransferase [Acidimicrobiales bacterium]RZV48167.1 MAG: GNAT family N-acetyltransferase [Acidimicrobiales bacterium]